MKILRAVMIGDVVGEPGLAVLEEKLPAVIKEYDVNFVTVNGENAADGFGLTEALLNRILAAGADVVTSGNHIWEKREFWPVLDTDEQILRPANYPPDAPGQGHIRVEKDGVSWIVINLQGRELMSPIDCPFRCSESILMSQVGIATHTHALMSADENGPVGLFPLILVDFHAESTREKEALGYYLDGRVSVIAGTHTHVQTADERILPRGTAYITDLGMTGNTASVIGMDPAICLNRARKQVLYRMEPARILPAGETRAQAAVSPAAMQGIIAEINASTGEAVSITRL